MEQKVIAEVILENLNQDWLLPSLQREFVWGVSKNDRDDKKIEKLFDSIMQHYPFGTILAWHVKRDHVKKWELYEFVKDYENGQHNNIPNPAGYAKLYLILDGQQRLSALNIGLKGSFTYKVRNTPKRIHLYLNLLSDIENDIENTYGLKYEFKFLSDSAIPQLDDNNFWIKTGDVLDIYNDSSISKDKKNDQFVKKYESITSQLNSEKQEEARRVLRKLYERFCETSILNIETTDTTDDEMLLNIFVRTNDGGLKLEKSDLLMAYMESSQGLFLPNGARKEIYGFVDHINKENQKRKSYNFSKDDILKASLVLSDLDIQYKLKNFNEQNLSVMSQNWEDIKKYFEMAVNLISKFGFIKLNAKNAIIPIAYWLKKEQKSKSFVDSLDEKDISEKISIAKWLSISLLKRVFGGSSDTTLQKARAAIQNGEDFSTMALNGKELTYEQLIKIIDQEKYGSENSHLILSIASSGISLRDPEQDHIHPKSKFNDVLYDELKLSDKDREFFDDHCNSLANIHLLPAAVNNEKSATEFLEWVKGKDPLWKETSLIPETSFDFSNFKEFIKLRKELIVEKLCTSLEISPPPK